MEKSQVNENFQIEKATEVDVKVKRNNDSINTENKDSINNSKVRKNTGIIRKKQLMCEYCQKKFNHTGDLNKHRRKHTGEQPYACNMCERKFTTSSNLVRHQYLHLGLKPFHCQICGHNFTRKIKLSAHLIAKHHEALKSDQ
ncbi:PREDICTED: zinc finger protein 883-like [Cyphomyrmex costatus]|uniref:zinc finger protein 883-like n=1 Tax=Cyphomyrmex costatus TaxID=456900 RepID=UPI0008521D44|nr:PREDICTED: zinc finger protein 883-like [Cyphomyrmex costatus]